MGTNHTQTHPCEQTHARYETVFGFIKLVIVDAVVVVVVVSDILTICHSGQIPIWATYGEVYMQQYCAQRDRPKRRRKERKSDDEIICETNRAHNWISEFSGHHISQATKQRIRMVLKDMHNICVRVLFIKQIK